VLSLLESTAEDQLDLARRLVATPSPNPSGDERAVVGVVCELLRAHGLNDLTTLEARPSTPNVIVRIPGDGPGPILVLSGHTDTKPAGDLSRWETDPWDPGVFPGATYALSFQGIAGIPNVAAFGPGYVPRAHGPNERLAVEGVNQAARIYALAASGISTAAPGRDGDEA
jgi:acetylornithine deacetylase/succinyl-diaminopimelate desuccinylase-like protein